MTVVMVKSKVEDVKSYVKSVIGHGAHLQRNALKHLITLLTPLLEHLLKPERMDLNNGSILHKRTNDNLLL